MIARALTEHETTTVQQGLEYLSHYSADGEVRHTARLLIGLFSQPDRIRFRTAGSEEFDPAPRVDEIRDLLASIGRKFDAGWEHFRQGYHVGVLATMAHISELAFPIIDQLEMNFDHIPWGKIDQFAVRHTYATPEGRPSAEEVWEVLSGMDLSGDPLKAPDV